MDSSITKTSDRFKLKGFDTRSRYRLVYIKGLIVSDYFAQLHDLNMHIQATLLNPDMCNQDFRLNRTDWKVPVPSYTYDSFMHNSDFA